MATRWFGAPVQRSEDPRLLRGKGNYVDDIDLPGTLHAAVLRSLHARARIVSIDAGAARELPGVHLVLIDIEYEPLPVVHNLDIASSSLVGVAARIPGGHPGTTTTVENAPLVHADAPGNVAAHFIQSVGDPDGIFATAPHTIRETMNIERGAAMPMEGRGVLARWEAHEGTLTCWISTQGPIPLRNGLAAIFQLPEHKVRVVAPDVGGGFG